jgi:hypothetical protein
VQVRITAETKAPLRLEAAELTAELGADVRRFSLPNPHLAC